MMILFRVSVPLTLAFVMAVTAEGAAAQGAPPGVSGEIIPLRVPSEHTVSPPHPMVTFTSTKEGALLQQWRDARWVSLCKAPCRLALDPAGRYQVDGPGMTTSAELRLRPGVTFIDTQPGTVSLRLGGIVVTSIGAVLLGLGSLSIAATTCSNGNDRGEFCHDPAVQGIGAVSFTLGALGAIVGVTMILQSGTTVETNGQGGVLVGGVRLGSGGLVF